MEIVVGLVTIVMEFRGEFQFYFYRNEMTTINNLKMVSISARPTWSAVEKKLTRDV